MQKTTDESEATLDQPLLAPHDHTLLLKMVHLHAARIVAAIGGKARLRPLPADAVLQAIARLKEADDQTRHTAQQVLSFLGPVWHVHLPASYEATLATVDARLAEAKHPMGVVHALIGLRDEKAHDRVPGFQIGVVAALDLIGDALETAGTMMTGVSVFGRRRPASVARECARGCVSGALGGSVNRVPPSIAAVVGGVAGTVTAALTAVIEQP